MIGAPLDFRLQYGRFGAKRLIHVHGDARELGRNRVPDAAITGDCAAVLEILADSIETPTDDRAAWLERLRSAEAAWWDRHRPEIESDASPIITIGSASSSTRWWTRGPSSSATEATSWPRCRVSFASTDRVTGSTPIRSFLGVGPVRGRRRRRRVPGHRSCASWETAPSASNGLDFDTLVRFSIPAVLVVGNDGAWGEIRIPQVRALRAGRRGRDPARAEPLRPPL